MNRLQEKLDLLLNKYAVDAKAVLTGENTVILNGRELPLLAHRSERRFMELRNIVNSGTLEGISVMRVARITPEDVDPYDSLYRELDLCQYILQRKLRSVMAVKNERVLNVIATAEDGVVCTVEISATLKKGEPVKDKHEIIARRGTACDVVVDAQLKQDSIYLFGNENQSYTDVDFELFGLSAEEIAVVRAAFAAAREQSGDQLLADDEELCRLVELAKSSVSSGERKEMEA